MTKPRTPLRPVAGGKGGVVTRKTSISGLAGGTGSIASAVVRKNKVMEKAETPEQVARAKSIAIQSQSKSKIDIEVMREFTPDFAAELIKNTPKLQRNVSQSIVSRYAADMLAGRWRTTGDPIRLTPSLELLDGQHRCHAVVKADVVLRDVVLEILHDERAFEAIDQGKSRNLRDIVKMSGGIAPEPTVMAAIIFEHLNFVPKPLSMPEKLAIVQTFPEMEVLKQLASLRIATAGMLAAFIRCMKLNREDAVKFYTAVFTNKPIIDGQFNDTAHLLATWIFQVKNTSRMGKSAEGWKRETCARCLSAWNAWRKGITLKRIVYDPDKPMPSAI
jgi:hypothetical protein